MTLLFPNISWPAFANTQQTGRQILTPPPSSEHPPGLPAIPTSLHGQYSTEPRGGGPSTTPTQTTDTQSLAGHPIPLLSPAPTTTKRQAKSVKMSRLLIFNDVMSHSKTFFFLLSSILFSDYTYNSFLLFLLVKQSLPILPRLALNALLSSHFCAQVLGFQAEAPHPAACMSISKGKHGRAKKTSRAGEMARRIRGLAAKPDQPSFIPGAHMMEGKNRFSL